MRIPSVASHTAETSVPVAETIARRGRGAAVCLVVLLLVFVASIAIGTKNLAPSTVWDALFNFADTDDDAIVRQLRLPRTLLGLVVGASLGIAGAVIAAVTRNPLADTQILGINSGASLFVVIAVGLMGLTSIWSYVWFAFVGAGVALAGVYAIGSSGRSAGTPVKLTLAGVALGSVMDGIGTGIQLLHPRAFDSLRFWNVGTLTGRPMSVVAVVGVCAVIGLILAAIIVRSLDTVALGDDVARSLGVSLVRMRALSFVAVALLAGAATAGAGPIGFVGLMVPHVVRWYVGPNQRWIFLYTLICAPILLLTSDIVGRVILRPGEVQVGIVTAFLGAPVLIWLVRRGRVSEL